MNSLQSQRNTIMHHLKVAGRLTTLEARGMGIMHPAMRVCELRKQGHDIVTNWMNQTDGAGVAHRVGVYMLEGGQK